MILNWNQFRNGMQNGFLFTRRQPVIHRIYFVSRLFYFLFFHKLLLQLPELFNFNLSRNEFWERLSCNFTKSLQFALFYGRVLGWNVKWIWSTEKKFFASLALFLITEKVRYCSNYHLIFDILSGANFGYSKACE